MKFPILSAALIAVSGFLSAQAFANAPTAEQKKQFEAFQKEQDTKLRQAAQSTNVKQSLVKICVENQTKMGAAKVLNASEINKLCTCTIESEGRMTVAQQWELQSARNAKDQKKYVAVAQRIGKAEEPKIKNCLGPNLQAKLTKAAKKS